MFFLTPNNIVCNVRYVNSITLSVQDFRQAQSDQSDIAAEANAAASNASSALSEAQTLNSEAQQLENDVMAISLDDINGE